MAGVKGVRVLIVQEDRVGAGVLAFMLRRAGCTTLLATNNEEARHAAGWGTPEVILSDATGAGLDGLGFAEELEGHTLRFFLCCDRSPTAEEELEAMRVGVADHLLKPVDAGTVLDRIQRRSPRMLGARPHPEGGIQLALDDRPLVDLLQMASRHRLNARLDLESAAGKFVLWVREGALIDAQGVQAAGREAATLALAQSGGSLVLVPLPAGSDEMRRPATIAWELTALLAQAFTSRASATSTSAVAPEPAAPAPAPVPAPAPRRRSQIGVPEFPRDARPLPPLPGIARERTGTQPSMVARRPTAAPPASEVAPRSGPLPRGVGAEPNGGMQPPRALPEAQAPWWRPAVGPLTPEQPDAPSILEPAADALPSDAPDPQFARPSSKEVEEASRLQPATRTATIMGTRTAARERQSLRTPGVTRPRVRIPTPAEVAPILLEPAPAKRPAPVSPPEPADGTAEAEELHARAARRTEPRLAPISRHGQVDTVPEGSLPKAPAEEATSRNRAATRLTRPDLLSPLAGEGEGDSQLAGGDHGPHGSRLDVLEVPDAASFWAREPEAPSLRTGPTTTSQVSSIGPLTTRQAGSPVWRVATIVAAVLCLSSVAFIVHRVATRPSPEDTYRELRTQADQAMATGQHAAALAKYEEIVKLQPADGEAQALAAIATFHARGCAEAERKLNEVKRHFESDTAFFTALLPYEVRCLIERQELDKARDFAQTFLELAPADHPWRREAEKLASRP
jgi:DNA-binding response OmpR family regulator